MAYNLMDEISSVLQTIPSGRILPAEEAQPLITTVAGKYGIDLASRFPWDKPGGIVYSYDDNPSGWGLLLSSMLSVFPGDVYLAVTDEGSPWPVIALPGADVQGLLLELPFFEYFIFDDAMERVVFDTHHNCLILCER